MVPTSIVDRSGALFCIPAVSVPFVIRLAVVKYIYPVDSPIVVFGNALFSVLEKIALRLWMCMPVFDWHSELGKKSWSVSGVGLSQKYTGFPLDVLLVDKVKLGRKTVDSACVWEGFWDQFGLGEWIRRFEKWRLSRCGGLSRKKICGHFPPHMSLF